MLLFYLLCSILTLILCLIAGHLKGGFKRYIQYNLLVKIKSRGRAEKDKTSCHGVKWRQD